MHDYRAIVDDLRAQVKLHPWRINDADVSFLLDVMDEMIDRINKLDKDFSASVQEHLTHSETILNSFVNLAMHSDEQTLQKTFGEKPQDEPKNE